MDQAILVALVMLVCVLTMLVLGIPISISIGLASTIAMLCVLPFENAMGTAAQKVFTGVNSFSLLAIPFFILAGNIMNNGGIAIRLVNCAKILSGRMPGALAETNVVANMLFGAISGSGVAAAAAIGGTIGPLEEKEGYSKDYMAAVNIASAPTGMLIPPSNTLIVYSTVAGSVSISALFMAGYLPGLLWGIGVMVIAGIMASKRGYRNRDEITLAIVLKTVWAAIPSLLLIVIVIGGILIGAFTATEGSAIAVVYSLLLSFIYRSIKGFKKDSVRQRKDDCHCNIHDWRIVHHELDYELYQYTCHYCGCTFGTYQQQDCHSSDYEPAASGGGNLHGPDPGNPYIYTHLPSDLHQLWHAPHPFRNHDCIQPVHRYNHAAGRTYSVYRLQGGKCEN